MNRTVAIIKYTRHLLLTWCSIGMILCRTGEFPTFHILFTILWIKMHVFSAANSWLNSAGNTLRSSCVCWLCVKWIDDHFMRLADIRRQIDTLIYGWNKRLDKLLSFSAGNVAVVGNNESFRRFFFVSASSGCGVVVFGDACECVATNRVCVCHHCGFTFFIRLELWCIHSDVCTPRRITMWSKSSLYGLSMSCWLFH